MNYLLDSRNSATYPSFEQRWLVVVFALALVIRVAYAFLAPQVDPFLIQDELHGDAADYDLLAQNLIQGRGFTEYPPYEPTSFRAPLYSFFLAGVYLIFGHSLTAVRLVQALLGALVCLFSVQIAARLFGSKVALFTGLGVALHPLMIYFGAWIITDTLFLALFTGTVLMALKLVEHPRAVAAVGTGACLGLSILTRPQSVLMLPLLLFWFILRSKETGLRAWLAPALLFVIATIAVLIPWTLRNYIVHGEWIFVSTQGGYTFNGANNPYAFGGHVPNYPPPIEGLSEVELDREYYRRGLDWIRSSPGDFVRLLPKKFVRLWSPVQVNTYEGEDFLPYAGLLKAIYLLYLALAIYGATRLGPNWTRSMILLFAIAVFTLAGLVYYGGTRYALPTAPFLVILAAVSLVKNPIYHKLAPGRVNSLARQQSDSWIREVEP